MTNNINHQKLETYCRTLAEKFSTEFFKKKNFASGEDILNFTPIEQVNLFIIKIIFDKWKEENERLRSPYFDYENADVKEAHENLMVKLSQHIAIRKEYFDNLLNKAIRDTLLIIIDPYFFIKTEYLSKTSMQLEDIKDREKYIRINKIFLQEFTYRMERENRKSVNVIEVGDLLDKVFTENKDKIEDIPKHLVGFSSLVPIQENELLNVSISRSLDLKPQQEIAKPRVETSVDLKPSEETVSVLNDKLKNNESSLFEKHSKSRIEDLRSAISMVQKFLFINELFKGDSAEFNKAIDSLNKASDLRAAHDLLHNHYANQYKWDPDKDEVKEFYLLVERKF